MPRFPETWWQSGRPLILGHRGACRAAPENTLAAFRLAAQQGADGVELDARLSADGVPVVLHNDRVDATTDGEGAVAALTLAQLKRLDAGGWMAPQFAGERIPTLEEVLRDEACQRLLVNIELKEPPPGTRPGALEAAVVDVVRRVGAEGRVWFSSFRPYSLYRVRQLAPEIPCGLLYSPLSLGNLLLAPFTPREALHPYTAGLSAALVRAAHALDLRVVAWTVNDGALAQRYAQWGVDALISDVPDALLAGAA